MARRKIENRNTRKLYKHDTSYAVTLPIEIIRELGWQDNQKVEVRRYGKKIIIEDWEE